MADVVALAWTCDRKFVLLSNGVILVREPDESYARLRVGKSSRQSIWKWIFEPWLTQKHSEQALRRIEAVLSRHRALVQTSNTKAYRQAQGAGPWPGPSKRARKRMITD